MRLPGIITKRLPVTFELNKKFNCAYKFYELRDVVVRYCVHFHFKKIVVWHQPALVKKLN